MTLIDYLPEGRLLINPFLEMRTEPVVGLPGNQGSTGYLSSDRNGDGVMDGYHIESLGGACWEPICRFLYPPE
jgi:hypothetical protein